MFLAMLSKPCTPASKRRSVRRSIAHRPPHDQALAWALREMASASTSRCYAILAIAMLAHMPLSPGSSMNTPRHRQGHCSTAPLLAGRLCQTVHAPVTAARTATLWNRPP